MNHATLIGSKSNHIKQLIPMILKVDNLNHCGGSSPKALLNAPWILLEQISQHHLLSPQTYIYLPSQQHTVTFTTHCNYFYLTSIANKLSVKKQKSDFCSQNATPTVNVKHFQFDIKSFDSFTWCHLKSSKNLYVKWSYLSRSCAKIICESKLTHEQEHSKMVFKTHSWSSAL